MARWHISPKIGPARCSSDPNNPNSIGCEFADSEGNEPEHFESKQEAENAYSKLLEETNKSISTLSSSIWDDYDDEGYSEYEVEMMLEDAVLNFPWARETYAEYLDTLPEGERKKKSEEYWLAIQEEDDWGF